MGKSSKSAGVAALLLTTLMLMCQPAVATEMTEPIEQPGVLPSGGTSPFGSAMTQGLSYVGPSKENAGSLTPGSSDLVPGKALLTIAAERPMKQLWDLQASTVNAEPIAKGDTLFVEFFMRTVTSKTETGEARAVVVIEQSKEPYDKTLYRSVSSPADGRWVRRALATKTFRAFAPGQMKFSLQFGFEQPQSFQIAALRVVNIGQGVEPSTLPVQRSSYAGREMDAPWRAAAAERIEKFRKGDLRIEVVDASGKPAPDATISVQMTRHAFPFGSAVTADRLALPGKDNDRYRQWVRENCTRVVMENHLKWPSWEEGTRQKNGTAWSRDTTLSALRWLNEQGIEIKGHNLIWPSWKFSPKDLRKLSSDPEALRKACDDHITDILTVTAPYKLVEWDVVNENIANHDITDVLGPGEIVKWFKLARQNFPSGKLLYNDYAHLVSGADNRKAFRDSVEALVKRLKAEGAPIDGMGIQAHLGTGLTAPAAVIAELDRLTADLGTELSITEFDTDLTDQDLQADYLRDFMTACFSHPNVHSFLMWGFWEKAHWVPNGALIRSDWTPKPAALAWNALVKKAWWTSATLRTGPDGSASVRGFKGTYDVTAKFGNLTRTANAVVIGDRPAAIKLVLSPDDAAVK